MLLLLLRATRLVEARDCWSPVRPPATAQAKGPSRPCAKAPPAAVARRCRWCAAAVAASVRHEFHCAPHRELFRRRAGPAGAPRHRTVRPVRARYAAATPCGGGGPCQVGVTALGVPSPQDSWSNDDVPRSSLRDPCG